MPKSDKKEFTKINIQPKRADIFQNNSMHSLRLHLMIQTIVYGWTLGINGITRWPECQEQRQTVWVTQAAFYYLLSVIILIFFSWIEEKLLHILNILNVLSIFIFKIPEVFWWKRRYFYNYIRNSLEVRTPVLESARSEFKPEYILTCARKYLKHLLYIMFMTCIKWIARGNLGIRDTDLTLSLSKWRSGI